ncbi:MAG: hypothetical protein GXO10_06595 [Crenarchaeota archaeon]|nr:hypothetical protein [Thermoproteota archaeon]
MSGPGKITKRWLDLDPTSTDSLTASVIPYDDSLSIKEAIDSRGGLGVTEMLQYEFLLSMAPYKYCWFDTFIHTDSVDSANTNATYNTEQTCYDGVAGSQLQTVNLLANDTNTYYSFFFVMRTSDDSLINAYYSIDGGTTWNAVSNMTKIVTTFSNNLIFRFSYLGVASVYSYGVLYGQEQVSYTSDVQAFQYMTVASDHTAPYQLVLPNNMVYTKDGKSLEVYLNRVRLANGYDFKEIDNRTIELEIDLKAGDTLLFVQRYGVVDNSIENQHRLDYEHNEIGQHIFKDLATGKLYRLVVINGAISLLPA